MLKDGGAANPDMTIRDLDIGDIEQVHGLFEQEFRTLDHGFLVRRSLDDFGKILRGKDDCVAVGAFQDDVLVGYSLGQLEHRNIAADVPFLRDIAPESPGIWPKVWSAKGTVVDHRFRGNRLMARLQIARSQASRTKGLSHWFGLVAFGNTSSLAGIFRARFWIIGTEADEYCLNFLCYEGSLNENRRTMGTYAIDCQDADGLAGAFAGGLVGTALRYDEPSGQILIELTHPAPVT